MSDKIRIRFDSHGLGDVVHCCTAMHLYINRGYDVAVQVEANKRWVFQAAGIPIYTGSDSLPIHPYHYPNMRKFFDVGTEDHLYSKIAHLFEVAELPKIGTKEDVWREICNERIDASHAVSETAKADIAKFLEGLPKPIVLLHSKGTNWQEEKSIPDPTAFELLKLLVNSFSGSVIVLDWDSRAPSLCHPRVRGICPHFGHMSTEQFGALCMQSDLLIGVDSGPFHLAGWFDIPTLFVARKIPPVRCCLPSPMATYLVSSQQHDHWAARGPEWRFVEFNGPEATPKDIVFTATQILRDNANPMTSSKPKPQLIPELIPGKYIYRRIGHDERPMELLEGGKIGTGAAGCERVWAIEKTPVGNVVTVYGDHGGPTFHLTLDADGVMRGRWLAHEKMPVELVREAGYVEPKPEVVRWNDLESNEATQSSCTKSSHPSDSLPDAKPPFYVGVLTYNCFDLLKLAIEAVLRSTLLPQKIYVVDNSGGKWHGHSSRRIEIIRPPYNLGVSRGLNVLQNLTQPYPLIVGADDIEVGPDLFEKMLAHQTPIVLADESRPYSVHIIRSEAWDKIGPWDSKFYPAYHEDNDYTMRAKLAGVEIGCPVSSGFIDHGPSATKSAMSQAERKELDTWFAKNRSRYISKWGGTPHMETFTQPFNGVKQ